MIAKDPSMIWIVLSIVGALFDVATISKGLRAVAKPAQELAITGEVSKFEEMVVNAVRLGELDAKMADKITLAARMRTGYNNAAKNFYKLTTSRLYIGIDPAAVAEMVKIAYYSIREGINSFDQFLLGIKRVWVEKKLLTSIDDVFTPEEMAAIKKAWKEAGGDVEKGIVKVEQGVVDIWQLGKQTLGKPSSSKILGENLEAIGKTRPPNSAAHHISAGGSNNVDAINARNILQREGIDINEGANGVFLPKSSKYVIDEAISHSRVHTNLYYKTVFERLNAAPIGKVREELQKIADELLKGTFPY